MDARGISAATLGAYPGLTSILTALLFPGWEILAEAGIGSPGSEIIAKADEWRPDLRGRISWPHGARAYVFRERLTEGDQ
jgi:hypothetical protein